MATVIGERPATPQTPLTWLTPLSAPFLCRVLDEVPSLVTVWDGRQRNLFANAASLQWWAPPGETLAGRHMADVVGAAVYELNEPYVRAALAGSAQVCERTVVGAGGTSRSNQVSFLPWYRDGACAGLLTVATDISQRVASETAARATADRLAVLDERWRISVDLALQLTERLAAARALLEDEALDDAHVITVGDLTDETIAVIRGAVKHLRDAADVSALTAAVDHVVQGAARRWGTVASVGYAGAVQELSPRAVRAVAQALDASLSALPLPPGGSPSLDITVRVANGQAEVRVVGAGTVLDERRVPVVAQPLDEPAARPRPAAPPAHQPGRPAQGDLSADDLMAVLDEVPAVIAAYDRSYRNLFANRTALRWFGRDSRADALGRHESELLPPGVFAGNERYAEAALAGTPRSAERSFVDDTGAVRHAEVTFAPLLTGGRPDGMVVVATDITARLAAEQQLRTNAEQAVAVAERNRVAENLHDLVLQHLYATELALPLATDSGAARAAKLRTAARVLDVATADLAGCVAVARDDSAPSAADVDGAVRAAVQLAAAGTPSTVRVSTAGMTLASAALQELLAVLNEALSNVVRHSGAARVDVAVTAEDRMLRLVVVDDGTGIAGEHTPGNGLANMWARALRRGGTLTLRDRSPSGTVLTWSVPLA